MLRNLIVCLSLCLCGCVSMMPDKKVIGIDDLRITEHILSPSEVSKVCNERLGIGPISSLFVNVLACATIVLETWSCDIYYSLENAIAYPELLKHERLHCQGYWHDNRLQEYYDEWYSERGIGIFEDMHWNYGHDLF